MAYADPPFVDAFLLCGAVERPSENTTNLIGIADTKIVTNVKALPFRLPLKFYISVKHAGSVDKELRLTPRIRVPSRAAYTLPGITLRLQAGQTASDGELDIAANAAEAGEHLIELLSDSGEVLARTIFDVVLPQEARGTH